MSLALTTTSFDSERSHGLASACVEGLECLGQWVELMQTSWVALVRQPVSATNTDVYWWRIGERARALPSAHHRGTLGHLTAAMYPAGEGAWSSFDTSVEVPFHRAKSTAETTREILDSGGLTRDELAEVLGLSRRTIQNWLSGAAANRRSRDHLEQLANLLSTAKRWEDGVLSRWMRMGNPTPYDLLAGGQWVEFRELLVQGPRRRPVQVTSGARLVADVRGVERGEPEDMVSKDELLASMRSAMATASLGSARTTAWRPPGLRELDDE